MALLDLLSLFDLRDTEQYMYEQILQHGPLRASDVAKHTGLNRTSTYDLLERLLEAGLIYETKRGEVKYFASQPPDKIQLLVGEKQQSIDAAFKALKELKSRYGKNKNIFRPRFRVFEGQQELQQMMKDVLLYNDITVYAYWPVVKVVEVLGTKFQQEFHEKRIQNNIQLKTIWPYKEIPSFKLLPFLEPGNKYKREMRIAPKTADFSLGYAIYGHTVRFISSTKENFGFLIDSLELAEMMRSQFELVWRLSKSLKIR